MLNRQPLNARHLNRKYRAVFFAVVENYNQIRATIGQAQALNYETSDLGKAKYKNDVSFLKVIDYTIDVENVVKRVLTPGEIHLFNRHYKDKKEASPVSTIEMMHLQANLGRIFLARGLYPISNYFKG